MKKRNSAKIRHLRNISGAEKDTVGNLNDLLGFLSPNNYSVDKKRLKELLGNDLLEIYVIEADGRIIGMGSLHYTETLVKRAAWIEDVVVHPGHQHKGLGRKIMKHLIVQAKKRGVKHIDLTSRNNRKKAHKFYQKLKFEKRPTSVYRLRTKKK